MGKQHRLYPGIHECCEPYQLVLTDDEVTNIVSNGDQNHVFVTFTLNKINDFLVGCLLWKN